MKKHRVLKRFMICFILSLLLLLGTGLASVRSFGYEMTPQAAIISGVYDDEDDLLQDSYALDNDEGDEDGHDNELEDADDGVIIKDNKINILILSSYSMRDTIVEHEIEGISNILSESSYNLSFEFMDSRRYDSEEDIEIFYAYLSNKLLNGKKYDCIIACDDAALSFLTGHDELIDGVPVVYMGIQDEENLEVAKRYDNITGITENYDYEGNIRAIHNMLPKVNKLYIIIDNSYIGGLDHSKFLEIQGSYSEFEWNYINYSETDIDSIKAILQSLDSDSAVIISDVYESSDGSVNSFSYNAVTLAEYSAAPVFCLAYDITGHGIVGGIVYDCVESAQTAALMAMQIINGKKPSEITIISQTPTIAVYDKKVLDRYGISISSLPDRSVIRNAPPSFIDFLKAYYGIIIPAVVAIIAIFIEILFQSHRQRRLLSTDYLTGLPNRGYLDGILREMSGDKKLYGYIIVDIDDFRSINDLYGNITGDKVIVETSSRLNKCLLGKEILGRLGGDEFIIILKDQDVENIEDYCRDIIGLFDEPIVIDMQQHVVNVTVGAAMRETDMDSITALNNASEALRYAKENLRHNYYFFNSDLGKAQIRRRVIKTTIEEAIALDGFEIFYQPQFKTGTDELFGVEALVRLKNNVAGPGEFIPVAEENLSIIRIDRIVTDKTIRQWHNWLEMGYKLPPVSINFSNIQLNDSGYPNYVFERLANYYVDPSYIVIEITESSFLTTSSRTTDYFNKFTDGGIRLSIDDYGTGYSSLSYLTRLPFSCLKIDQSLIRTEPTKENLFMIEKIVEIAHSRNYKVVAEGVETKEQEDFLHSVGCDATQGFMRGKPMKAEELEKILEMQRQNNG